MFLKQNVLKILVIATVIAIAAFIVSSRGLIGGSSPDPERDQQTLPQRAADREALEPKEGSDPTARTHERDRALAELKKKWQEYFEIIKNGGDESELHRMKVELAQESAARLLASLQARELLSFLNDAKAGSAATTVRRKIKELFESGRTDELVGPLVEAITEVSGQVGGQYGSDLLGWSYLLGKHGSDADAEHFKKSVDNPWPLGDFLHGWYLSQASVDPLGSYTSMVEFLKGGGKGARQGQSLENMIKAFPEEVSFDYEAMEAILPVGVKGPDEEVYRKARRGILTKWAKEEPANAVNYIIDHPERVPVELVTDVVRVAISNFHHDGIEWVKDFPEGIYYDRAAVAVVQKLWETHPKEAREWAMSIGDEEIRKVQLLDIETIQKRNTRR